MIKDIEMEMRKRGINGLVVYGGTTLANPSLTYVVGGNLARGGIWFKRAGNTPLLVVSNLDVGTARKSRRAQRIQTYTDWGFEKLLNKYHRRDDVTARLIAKILQHEGVSGKVALFGRNDLATGIHLTETLRKIGVRIVGERSPTILEVARETKEKSEITTIRAVGNKTAAIISKVTRALRNARRKRARLYLGKKRATIGLVKAMISARLAEERLLAPEGTIFAQGPSAADPHNRGIDANEIREGKLIVFDIFPQAENEYWFDLTRTFVIGRADVKAKKLFETVHEAQTASLDVLRAGVTGQVAMNAACDVIERAGYRTMRQLYEGRIKAISSGFNHSLGHGVGLTIGERPYLAPLNQDPLKRGHVVTVEPGVYLPKYGGVRIEDTVLVTAKGYQNLAKVDTELELT